MINKVSLSMLLVKQMGKPLISGYRLLLGYLGVFLFLIGIIVLLPLVLLIFYPSEINLAKCFIVPGVLSIFLGYLSIFYLRGFEKDHLKKHQDAILVVAVWILAIFICAIPFVLTGEYNFTQAIFETTSGFTTTGLSVVNVENCPKIFLFFRSVTLFFGGVGLILVLTSAVSDRYGMKLYTAEGHSDKLLPNLAKSARLIISIYLGYIILGVIAYVIFGMPLFDAINHSIASLSTGGFSTKAASIGYYNSISIEIITMILMLLGSTNFFVHLLLIKGKLKAVFLHCETKFVLLLLSIGAIFFITSFCLIQQLSFVESFRIVLFQMVSALTTTGFQNISSMSLLPCNFFFFMILLMLIGGGLGSTAGGIKQYRMSIMFQSFYYNFKEKITNTKIVRKKYIHKYGREEELTELEISNTQNFVFLYMLIFFIGTFIFTCFGYSVGDAMFEFSSSLGTVGLSVGITGYNAHPIILWTSIFGMFFGRLEIYIIFIAIFKLTKRSKKE